MEKKRIDMPNSHDAMNAAQRAVKRIIDITGSATALFFLWPLILALVIMLKLQHNGPAIFSQERIGKGGKPFTIYKFRTMSKDTEKNGPQLVPHAEGVASTGLERFLREHHLDELPQLWNVLCGDMSIVGPRPERPVFVEKIGDEIDHYMWRYNCRPGITGWAQVNGFRGDTL